MIGWTYDQYENRWQQSAAGNENVPIAQPQLSFTGNDNRVDGWTYDTAGDILNDGRNSYGYDAEGCIVSLNGSPTCLYGAEGRRVAKCSGSTISASYLFDLAANQLTELGADGVWNRTNVWAGGRLLATYEGPGEPAHGYHWTGWGPCRCRPPPTATMRSSASAIHLATVSTAPVRPPTRPSSTSRARTTPALHRKSRSLASYTQQEWRSR